ncbi:Uncharacterised protein [Corynebacterium kutscheri]|uniref:Uncharacterized protein n=1 Tax=Corynebacterium kutscheri TaxID=35755 RepID=A0A0F6R0D4_9CORY|nr:hypothetical protein [Corynebacterium kutscheri]AKE41245.1 hypothetical protein UL82_05350 [Corynebacterium kutscheri]VEH08521.1 Uncharacterised protein [Corynebacterium kutscheri]VEH09567.1 Uncharacterised protein [Corynebacterium kutscheri]VEH79650.1 Uncharacterised protein [Corynebacterium kutscheri]
MNIRNIVYSPIQNIALWLGAWLYGQESFDDLDYALTELGGPHRLYGGEFFTTDFLLQVRNTTSPLIDNPRPHTPLLQVALTGPGDPIRLPPHSEAMRYITEGAIFIADHNPYRYHVLVPQFDASGCQWRWYEYEGLLPAPNYLLPGEADYALTQAATTAAQLIEHCDTSHTTKLPNPRLTVGSLSDFYENPGLPDHIPPRAAQLIARADRVAAIVETVTQVAQDHEFDPELLSLARHIRHARMAACTYALVEWAR